MNAYVAKAKEGNEKVTTHENALETGEYLLMKRALFKSTWRSKNQHKGRDC